jgi:DNA repair exonuclease SbcCD nuclease subunit
MLRFIHCADLHIDSPFKGMRNTSEEAAGELYEAPFKAFRNAVDLAISEEVDFMIIAGDAFDSKEKSLSARLRFHEQLTRLRDKGIKCFYCCGNHDPLDALAREMKLPDNCIRFGSGEVECFRFKKGDVAADIYGISFGNAAVSENLALKFKRRNLNVPAIAVLHCNVGSTAHEPYAPATLDDLRATGMDYWALGHVHSHCVLSKAAPAVVYPGCIQGCNPRETGVHGCCLVSIGNDFAADIEFHPLDVIRFMELEVLIDSCDDILDIISTLISALEDSASLSDGRGSVFRVTLTGNSNLDGELRKGGCIDNILKEVRERLAHLRPLIWLDRINLMTAGEYDVEELRKAEDFTSELISIYDALCADEDIVALLGTELDDVYSRWGASLDPADAVRCRELCREALHMTLSRINGGGGA